MVELALDDSILSGLDEKDWWFEEELPSSEEGEVFAGQGVCKWYVSLLFQLDPTHVLMNQWKTWQG